MDRCARNDEWHRQSNWPPSTARVCPVIHDAASLQRNTAALATSSGLPIRPQGIELSAPLYNCGLDVLRSSQSPPGNSIEPGAIAFTRIFFGAYIRACDMV